MNGVLTDVQQTLADGRGKLSLKYVAIALPVAALGLFVLYILYFDGNLYVKNKWEALLSGWGLAAFGFLVLARELYKLLNPGAP